MKERNTKPDIVIPEVTNDTNLSSRLAHALETIEKVLKVPRLDKEDRLVFARNLGELFEELLEKNEEQNFSKVLIKTFGQIEAESLIKKRKTLILCTGEEPQKGQEPQSRVHRFWLLAKVICQELFKDHKNLEALAALNLIKGSSYDFEGSVRSKFEQTYIKNLNEAFSFILKRVKSHIDLEWMYEWTKDHEVNASCTTGGELNAISHPGEFENIGLGLNKNFGGNEGAPSISIEERLIPFDVGIWAEAFIPEIDGTINEKIIALKEYLISDFNKIRDKSKKAAAKMPFEVGLEGYDSFIMEFDHLWIYPSSNNGYLDYLDDLEEDKRDRNYGSVFARMYVDYEIRYVEELSAWESSLVQRIHKTNGDTLKRDLSIDDKDILYVPSAVYCDANGNDAICLWRDDYEAVYAIWLGRYLDEDGNYEDGWQIFCINSDLKITNEKYATQRRYIGECSNYYDFCFNPAVDSAGQPLKRKTLLKGGWDYVEAPEDSIAAIILRNLTDEDAVERIDNLLIKDAKMKYEYLKILEKKFSGEFTSKLESLYKSTNLGLG